MLSTMRKVEVGAMACPLVDTSDFWLERVVMATKAELSEKNTGTVHHLFVVRFVHHYIISMVDHELKMSYKHIQTLARRLKPNQITHLSRVVAHRHPMTEGFKVPCDRLSRLTEIIRKDFNLATASSLLESDEGMVTRSRKRKSDESAQTALGSGKQRRSKSPEMAGGGGSSQGAGSSQG